MTDTLPTEAKTRTLQAPVLEALIAHIPEAKALGWREATIAAFRSPDDDEEAFRSAVMGLPLIPDAYRILPDTRELQFFEVEVTSPMSTSKLQSYAVFLTILDYYEVGFSVFSVNQHGHINEVHLLPHYIDWLTAQKP